MRYVVWVERPGQVMFDCVEAFPDDAECKGEYCWVCHALEQAWAGASWRMEYYRDPDTPWKRDLSALVRRIKRSFDAGLLFARTKEDA